MELFRLFLFLFSFVNVTHGYISGAFDCPRPWIEFDTNCYYFVHYPALITEAKSTCQIDSATLLKITTSDQHNFIAQWLSDNAKESLEWYTDGIRDTRTSSSSGASMKYMWESDGSEVTGQHFWYSNDARVFPGNRIVYYSDDAINWGWAMFNDTGARRPFVCQTSKEFIYKIVTIERGFDFGTAENDPNQLDRGPTFEIEPEDAVYDTRSASRTIQMVCKVTARPRPTYKWIVTRLLTEQAVNLSDPSITVTNGILSIDSPYQDLHNGQYYCTASNSFGSIRSHDVGLKFGYLNDFPKSRRDPVRVSAFTGIGIECMPPNTNYDTLVYSWYKDDPQNWIRPHVKWYTFVSSDGKLYFQKVAKEDQGNYTCFVSTPLTSKEGKSSMPIPLLVIEAVGSEQEPIIVNGFPKSFPSSPLVGEDVRVECIAFGTSDRQMDYSWTRVDGKPMPKSAKFSDFNRVMTIPNIQLGNAGKYRCTVVRQLGKQTYGEISLVVEATPYFTIPLSNEHLDVNTDLVWQCKATAIPAVTYSWYINATLFDPLKLPLDQRNRFRVSGNQMTISKVQFKDAGMYQCSASNTHGTTFSSAQLRILSFPPTFQKFPIQPTTYALDGGNTTLLCNPESSPPSTKEWLKDGMALNPSTDINSRVVQLSNGNLLIKQVTTTDEGNYTCQATNPLGVASSSGLIKVLPTLSINQVPRDTVCLVNTTAFFLCNAAYNPAVDVTYDWYHNSYKIMFIKVRNLGNKPYVFTEPNYERGTGISRGSLYINNVQFYHAGDYYCVVRSTTETVRIKALLTVEGPPGEPAGLTGSNVGATNITLTWWPGPDNGRKTDSFIIEAQNILEGYWRRMKIETKDKFDQTQMVEAEVTGLNPYTQYIFRVFGINVFGIGVASKDSPIYRTAQAPPVIYPLNLRGGGGKVGTLNMTWDPVPVGEWNAAEGEVGYYIHWKRFDMNDDQWQMAKISNPLTTKYTSLIGPANFYLPYNLRIQFYNPMGVGPTSPTVVAMSAEDLPAGVPINVKAVYHNATAIRVEWTPLPNTREVMKGVLLGYRINYWIDGEEDEQMALFRIIRNDTDNGLIIALRENTNYMINIQVVNTAGNGPKSETYRTATLRAAPKEAPQQVTVSAVDESSVALHWRGVYTTIDEEPLQGYVVRYWRRGENIYVATNIDVGKRIRYTLKGLEQYVQYELRVYGYSRGGDGLQSSPTLEFIIGDNAQIIRDSPDKEYIVTKTGYSSFMLLSGVNSLSAGVFVTVVPVLITVVINFLNKLGH